MIPSRGSVAPIRSPERWVAWLPWWTGALLALPLLVTRYPPMTDLPLFEGALALLRHWRDPAFVPPHVYELNLGRTTQLSFALAFPLAQFLSTAAACKVLVAASIVAIEVGVARLARYLGAPPAAVACSVFLATPVALGWIVFIGFVGYLVGTAIWLLALPLLDRWADAPTLRRGVAACVVVVLLHFAHLASAACAVVTVVVMAFARGIDRRTPLRLLPAALSACLAAADMHFDRAIVSGAALSWEQRGMVWPPAHIKWTMACDYLFGAVGTVSQVLLLAVVAIVVLAAALLPPRSDTRSPVGDRGSARRRFVWLAAVLLVAYLASPWAIGAGAYFDARFLPPAWLVGVAALAPGGRALAPRLAAACIPVAWLAVVWPIFADSDQEHRALAGLEPLIAPSSATAVLSFWEEGGQPYLHVSAGNRVLAERGGRVLYSLTEAPRAPVLVARRARWDEAVARLYHFGAETLCPEYDATRFRYLLVRVPDLGIARAAVRALSPDYRMAAAAGAWVLLESTHPTVPLDAPDAAPPARCVLLGPRIAALSSP